MYNRYIRNDYGSYTRIPQEEVPPPPPPKKEEFPPPPPPPPQSCGEKSDGKFFDRILEKLHLGDLNTADLLLLALLFFLFEEKADDELLIALGLLLIL
ncbi:MAG: hypothetical protein IKD11_01720 [Oscillospiraceae bacterium]|nr:hypothetical protein [Oscillospiraceae bacterium]